MRVKIFINNLKIHRQYKLTMNYESYHRNPINKLIHTICIPLIVITTFNLIKILLDKMFTKPYKEVVFVDAVCKIQLEILVLILPFFYLFHYNLYVSLVMFVYYFVTLLISDIWKYERKNYVKETIIIFALAWVMQFIGHYIEGNRPALFDSITTAFTEAPLYSLNNIINIL